ncbi:MAG: class I SAM-dependent methyltransferase [Candidatus Harrisonbacteria bacterium]|nr:class I SAM-dependent methyltransferase [Candidatus Harrisonbacteria bacterium]
MIQYSDELVRRTNELFYNLGGESYDHSHDEIIVLEVPRWKKIAELFLKNSEKKRIVLDVGCGTGFVPSVICPYLKRDDEMICADISREILNQCRTKLGQKKFDCNLSYKIYDGTCLPLENYSADVITMNSVLHHIPDTGFFLKEVSRVLKKGGYLIIGHEANALFYKNWIIWTLYRILYVLYHPKSIFDILRKRGFLEYDKTILKQGNQEDELTAKINNSLLAEGLINQRLTRLKIDNIVEYYNIRGFTIKDINQYLNFELIFFETYNHLYWVFVEHYKNPFIVLLNKILGFFYPKDGKNMLLIFKKP